MFIISGIKLLRLKDFVTLMIQCNYCAHLQKKIFEGLLKQSIEIDILQSNWEYMFQPKWSATQVKRNANLKIDAKKMNRPQLTIAGCMKQHLFDYKLGSKKILSRISLWLFTMSATRFQELFKIVSNQQRIYTSCRVSLSWRWMWSWWRWYWTKWKSIWVRNHSDVCCISVWGLKWASVYFESRRKRNSGKRRDVWIWTYYFHRWILSMRIVFENREV